MKLIGILKIKRLLNQMQLDFIYILGILKIIFCILKDAVEQEESIKTIENNNGSIRTQ